MDIMGYVRRSFWAGILLASLVAPSAQAGGLYLYELGTPDVGAASAGWSARAQDAGTVFTNPAGMTRLEKSELLAGVQPTLSACGLFPGRQHHHLRR